MLKFRCQHCGQRIAVGARHLGKLVTCPECGKPTHPLAEQIVSLQAAPAAPAPVAPAHTAPPPAPAPPAVTAAEPEERCANCGDAIGRLQKRNAWQDHVVCTPCYTKLSGETTFEGPDDPAAPKPLRVAARRATRESDVLARGAATAGRLALAGAWAVGALMKASAGTGSPEKADAHPRAVAGPSDLPALAGRPDRRPSPLARGDALRDAPAGPAGALPLHTRLMIALAVICLAGAGVYAALSLLRELTGYLTAAAFLLMAGAGGYLLVRLSVLAGRRFFPLRAAGTSDPINRDAEPLHNAGE